MIERMLVTTGIARSASHLAGVRRSPSYLGFTVAAAGLFVILFVIQCGRPLQLDNMDFPAVAEATARSGLPIYYRGEALPQFIGLYHPPLYIYALAGWFHLLGPGAAPARLFGLVCAVLAALITIGTVSNVFGRSVATAIAPVFMAVYLLNPFALQVFSIVDIDPTVYTVLLGAALWASTGLAFRNGERRTEPITVRSYAILAAILTLCFWTKLTTVFALPVAIVPTLAVRLGWLRAAWHSLALYFLAGMTFVFTYAVLYSWATGLDTRFTFQFILESLSSKAPIPAHFSELVTFYARRFAGNMVTMSCWGMLPPLAGAGTVLAGVVWLALRPSDQRPNSRPGWLVAGSLVVFALLVVAGYSLVTSPFGGAPFKYVAPAWPIIAMSYAGVLTTAVRRTDAADHEFVLMFALGVILACVTGAFVLKDHALLSQGRFPLRSFVLPLAMAIAITAARAAWRLARGRVRGEVSGLLRQTVLLLAAMLIGESFGTAIYQTQAVHATQYDYGERGFRAVCQWVEDHTSPRDVIVSMKDVGFATGRRYIESAEYLFGPPSLIPQFEANVSRLDVRLFIFTREHGQDWLPSNPALQQWITQNTAPAVELGDYVVYRRNR